MRRATPRRTNAAVSCSLVVTKEGGPYVARHASSDERGRWLFTCCELGRRSVCAIGAEIAAPPHFHLVELGELDGVRGAQRGDALLGRGGDRARVLGRRGDRGLVAALVELEPGEAYGSHTLFL